MWAIVVVVTLLISGQPNVTRHVSVKRFDADQCEQAAQRIADKMQSARKQPSTAVEITCERQDDIPT